MHNRKLRTELTNEKNRLILEVATTLERECYPLLEGYNKMLAKQPTCGSGITSRVRLNKRGDEMHEIN